MRLSFPPTIDVCVCVCWKYHIWNRFWCIHMTISVSVQYEDGFLSDIVISLCSHLSKRFDPPPNTEWMVRGLSGTVDAFRLFNIREPDQNPTNYLIEIEFLYKY